jgi:hypothetical protein
MERGNEHVFPNRWRFAKRRLRNDYGVFRGGNTGSARQTKNGEPPSFYSSDAVFALECRSS